jgi:hypothetical protein
MYLLVNGIPAVKKNPQKSHNLYCSNGTYLIILGPLSESKCDAHVGGGKETFEQNLAACLSCRDQIVGLSVYRSIMLNGF